MADPHVPLAERRQLIAEANAEYQRRMDDVRAKEQALRLRITTLRHRMQTLIVSRARGGQDLVLAKFDAMQLPAHEKLDTDTIPKACKDLMAKIEDAIDELFEERAHRARLDECRWLKLAQYLTPTELVEHLTDFSARAAQLALDGNSVSPAVAQLEEHIEYRGDFKELIDRKPYVQARNGGSYYDIYVRTSSPEDRVYIGGPPEGGGGQPPKP